MTYRSTRESTVRWKSGGLAIDSLELRSADSASSGRIFVTGEVPDLDPGRFDIRIDSLRVAPWLTLLQSDVPIDGMLSLTAVIEGTRSSPMVAHNWPA